MSRDTTRSKDQKVIAPDQQKRFITMNYLAKFGVYRSHESKDIAFFECHVTPCDLKIKRSLDMPSKNFPSLSIVLPSLMFIGLMEVEI